MSRFAVVLVVAAASLTACGKGQLNNVPAGTTGASTVVPALSVGIVACTPTANAINVGAPCSKSGGQCANTGAPFCSADYASSSDPFCTKLCTADSDCGSGATCAGDANVASLKACIPNSCMADANSLVGNANSSIGDANGIVIDPNAVCPPAQANSEGVGTPCSSSGSECKDTQATYCSVDYIQTPYAFCTKLCSVDSDCGSDATCMADPSQPSLKACIPTSCSGTVSTVSDPNTAVATSCIGAGNANGIGKVCTAGKADCPRTADLCTGDLGAGSTASFCTTVCKHTSECGEGAQCLSDPQFPLLSACVPTACISPE